MLGYGLSVIGLRKDWLKNSLGQTRTVRNRHIKINTIYNILKILNKK